MPTVDVDSIWFSEQLAKILINAEKELRADSHPIKYDSVGMPILCLPSEAIVHVLRKHSCPVFYEIFQQARLAGDPNPAEIVMEMCRHLFSEETAMTEFYQFHHWFSKQQNISEVIFYVISKNIPEKENTRLIFKKNCPNGGYVFPEKAP